MCVLQRGMGADEGYERKGQAETRTGVWVLPSGNGTGQDVRRNMRRSVNRATDQKLMQVPVDVQLSGYSLRRVCKYRTRALCSGRASHTRLLMLRQRMTADSPGGEQGTTYYMKAIRLGILLRGAAPANQKQRRGDGRSTKGWVCLAE